MLLFIVNVHHQAYLFKDRLKYLSRKAFKSRKLLVSCKLAKQIIAPFYMYAVRICSRQQGNEC